ncbi:MAG TPA: hypothetical protein VF651_00725 [Gammaproteobacteria bacterium]
MNSSNFDSKNAPKQDAGNAPATAQSTQQPVKANGAGPEGQNTGATGNDKGVEKQGAQPLKTDGAASDKSGKEAAGSDDNQASAGTSSAPTAGKKDGVAPGLAAKSND